MGADEVGGLIAAHARRCGSSAGIFRVPRPQLGMSSDACRPSTDSMQSSASVTALPSDANSTASTGGRGPDSPVPRRVGPATVQLVLGAPSGDASPAGLDAAAVRACSPVVPLVNPDAALAAVATAGRKRRASASAGKKRRRVGDRGRHTGSHSNSSLSASTPPEPPEAEEITVHGEAGGEVFGDVLETLARNTSSSTLSQAT